MRSVLIFLACFFLLVSGASVRAVETQLPAAGMTVPQLRALQAASKKGDARAQYLLARAYVLGDAVPKDRALALKWLRQSAAQGLLEAQAALGVFYEAEQRYEDELKWRRLVADQGNANAQYRIGVMYTSGYGVKADDAEAARWLRKAAEQDHDAAQYMLGAAYAFGKGVAQDDVQALLWFNLAAAKGNDNAIRNRDFISLRMTPAQRVDAVRLTKEWKPHH